MTKAGSESLLHGREHLVRDALLRLVDVVNLEPIFEFNLFSRTFLPLLVYLISADNEI